MSADPRKAPQRATEARELDVAWVDPLEVSAEIKELFRSGGEEEFARNFQLIYPWAVDAGGGSIVARDPGGRLVMHIAALPRRFRDAERVLRGGLLVHHMVEESYRDFWSPMNYLRSAIQILGEKNAFDFLMTDLGETAFALTRAGGFDFLDSLRRYVFPLVPGWFTLQVPVVDLDSERLPWRDGLTLLDVQEELGSGGAFRPVRTEAFYESRVRTNLTEESEWMVLRLPGRGTDAPPVALVLATPFATHHTLGIMDLMWDEERAGLESVLNAVAVQARAQGFRKLVIRALELSRLGEAIQRCGFVARPDDQPILIKPLEDGLRLPPSARWLLTWIDAGS